MKILLLLYLLYAPQSGSSQRFNWFNKNGSPQASRDSSNRFGTPMRIKPGLWKNLLPLTNKGHQDAALAPGFKVQGTALIKNGKVKLDLMMQRANARLKDPSATAVPVSTLQTSATPAPATATPTSAVGLTSAAPTTTSGTPSTTSAPSVTPVFSTLPPSTTLGTTSGPTTLAVTTVPTTPAITGTTAIGSTTAGATSAPTTEPTTVATIMATTTQGPTATTAPVSTALPTTSSATLGPSLVTSAPPIPTSSSATTTIVITRPTSPKAPLPGGPTKPTCESPVNVNIMIIAKEVLKSHNAYRRTHASPELHLDSQMTCDAQTFAQEIAHKGILQHQASEILAKKKLGENIGMSCAPVRSGRLRAARIIQMAKNVAKRWYDEVCQYNFDKPNTIPSTGHFTEIVWSGTKKLGVGFAVGRNAVFPGYECVYVVGRYQPAGNIIGGRRLQMNVKSGSFNRAYCQKRSTGFQGDPWDKRNHLKHKESGTRRLYGHSKHHI